MRAKVADGGRIVIPASFRHALGIGVGDEVILELQDGELRVFSPARAIQRAQRLVRDYVPQDRSLAAELVAERRAEAARE